MDIGCDHCYLAISLLQQHKAQTVINIDIHPDPLAAGIKNLQKYGLIDHTINLVNDGLKDLKLSDPVFQGIKSIDTCVIAGMGSNNIIEIHQKNHHHATLVSAP